MSKSNRTHANLEEFRLQRKVSSGMIKNEKRQYGKQSLQQIQTDFIKNNSKGYYQALKRHIKGYEPLSLKFKNKL